MEGVERAERMYQLAGIKLRRTGTGLLDLPFVFFRGIRQTVRFFVQKLSNLFSSRRGGYEDTLYRPSVHQLNKPHAAQKLKEPYSVQKLNKPVTAQRFNKPYSRVQQSHQPYTAKKDVKLEFVNRFNSINEKLQSLQVSGKKSGRGRKPSPSSANRRKGVFSGQKPPKVLLDSACFGEP